MSEEKVCIYCGGPNTRARSEICSNKCRTTWLKANVPKTCEHCQKDHHRRGRTCSKDCAMELKKKTNLEKFGSEWAIQTPEAKQKRVETNIKKYGKEHHLQTEESLARLRATNRERYGVDYVAQNEEIKAKQQETLMENYGVDNPFKSAEIQKKIKQVNIERYGFESAAKNPEIQEKIKNTVLQRYGVDNSFKAAEVKEKIKSTLIERYGVEHPAHSEEIREKFKETSLRNYGVDHPMKHPNVRQKVAKAREDGVSSGRAFKAISQHNRNFAKKIEERYGVEVAFEKAIDGKSYDLHIVGTNILIELNPLISHNADIPYGCVMMKCGDKYEIGHETLPHKSHMNKSKIARANGYRLIHAYEWDERENLFKLLDGKLSKAKSKLSARKLELSTITSAEASSFFALNHIQGSVKGASHTYGLFHEGALCS